jgi:SAM-dependent methyltransferase/peroxiredoxin
MEALTLFGQPRDVSKPIGELVLSLGSPGNQSAKPVKLSNYRGRVVVLLVLGVTCNSCRRVATVLSHALLQHSTEAAGIGICVQSGCGDRLEEFASPSEIRFPLTSCRLRDLCPALGIPSSTWLFYPTLIFIDQKQRLRGLFISGDPFFQNLEANLRSVLDQLVAEASAGEPCGGDAMSTTLQISACAIEHRLDSPQIAYYGRYFGDPLARLFWHEGGLCLGILSPHGERFRELTESEIFRTMVSDKLLIALEPYALRSDAFEVTYRLETTPRVTYWHEWSPKMLRAAALRMLDLLERLAAVGLTLRNPHPWNLFFHDREFSYANAGSIVPFDQDTFQRAYEKVARFFVRPLLLLEHGFEHVARRLLQDVREGALVDDVRNLQCAWAELPAEPSEENIPAFLAKVSEGIKFLGAQARANRWADYFQTDCDFSTGISWSRKQETLLSLLEDPEIRSVLDLGANTGHYAKLAAQHGREVIAADFDPALVDAIYLDTLDRGQALYPVVLDFTHPTPGEGVGYRWFPPAIERLSADLVLCFALEHHLVFGKYRLDFEQVASGVRAFSRAWALVEYVERGKIRPAEWRPDADAWYSVEQLASVLNRHFPAVEILPPATDGRRLLICGPKRRRT